jgi:hypothetical protein
MILKQFVDISTGFRFSKISVECSVHLCSCPWIDKGQGGSQRREREWKKVLDIFLHVFNVGGQTVSCLGHPPTIGLLGLSQSRGP